MRLHRFYLAEAVNLDSIKVKDERLIHQWRNVFRYNVGSEIVLFDGSGYEFQAVIESLTNREADLGITKKKKGVIPDGNIILCQSLIKKDNLEWIVEKATELGVSKIIPILSERSEKKDLNIERARKIAVEASEQCGRADVPEISCIVELGRLLENIEGEIIVFDSSGKSLEEKSIRKLEAPSPKLKALFIGPEGGWTDRELELFKQKTLHQEDAGPRAHIYSMGPLTLRAETAAISALTYTRFFCFQ